ncbi:hypothetical protein NM208_g9394 [Fusarium decemcellulare]|uniref:Uncharacterized protein n=1 Tax=Fusarium decemcellulare TaxID=57161 RepID=A0ACC1S1R1_9HYPO|nr:hypothetical protein NM208_g9394 [Fusarium decemcellulare]
MSRLLKLLPSIVFLTIIVLFLLNLYDYDYPEVQLPEGWKPNGFGGYDKIEKPVATPGSFADDDLEGDYHNGDVFGDDDDRVYKTYDIDLEGDLESETETVNITGSEKEAVKINISEIVDSDSVDWSRFAYVQYVTGEDYLCNSVMIFETLHRLGSKADRLMMYPREVLDPEAEESDNHAGQLLIKAREEYNVKLQPITVQRREGDDLTWADSFTKLLAFNQTQYDRVISLDSDGVVLQHVDELFQLPPCPVAMPRAYWLYQEDNPDKILSSQVMVVQPSEAEFSRVQKEIENINPNEYDMEIVNHLYLDNALVLPHRPYNMLTSEFRRKNHSDYLGSDTETWNPIAALGEAKYVHFSDYPVPKPWIPDVDLRRENEPDCRVVDEKETCIEREIWNKFYTDFLVSRERICESVGKTSGHQRRRNWNRLD